MAICENLGPRKISAIRYLQFCGEVIAGVSLISSSVMKMQHRDDPGRWIHALLPRCSLYIMRYGSSIGCMY